MKITAPDSWLDDVDIPKLWQWFLDRGWTVGRGNWLCGPDYKPVILSTTLRDYRDWRLRLLEAIDEAARVDGITAAEWFVREQEAKPSDWKEFGTEPQNGTKFLAWRQDAGVLICWWADVYEDVILLESGGDDITADPPSHWMPLPSGPTQRSLLP